ncbi:MAG: hypothetical protein HY862_12670 [Chloroflexi bacterium]|nr:hypothetical protein [Chloroflexota bacterium]
MPVPTELQEKINKGLEAVETHSRHHFHWSHRKGLYPAFGTYNDPNVLKARGWLAVLTAQYVFPILEATPTEIDDLLHSMLKASVGYLNGIVSAEEIASIEDEGYHTLGNWADWDDPGYSPRADIAARAVYKAAGEVRGKRQDPFEYAKNHTKYTLDGPISGDTFSDSDWVSLAGVGDTAGCAALAYAATDENVSSYSHQKLEEFWKWWLLEAIPQAWALAEASPNQSIE